MVVNFSSIVPESDGSVKFPVMVLKSLHGGIIGVIGKYMGLSLNLKYNDVSSISFKVPAYDNGIQTKFYGDICSYHVVEIDPYGVYVLPAQRNTGTEQKNIKNVLDIRLTIYSRT